MDRFEAMQAFARTAELGSLSAAARAIDTSPASVSRLIAGLEDRLGARLIERTTRRLTLTESGRLYLERCRRILDELGEAEQAVAGLAGAPAGELRVSGPTLFGRHYLAAALPGFLARHPGVSLSLDLADRFVNLVEEGVDVAVRIGEPKDSSLIARRLGSFRRVVVAAPDYLLRDGEPARPEELAGRQCLRFTMLADAQEWRFARGPEQVSVKVGGRLRANNADAAIAAALNGGGITLASSWQVREHVRAGRLRLLLADWRTPEIVIQALYPSARHLSPKVRAFVDYLAERWREEDFGAAR